jgi:hypothetical protein
MFIDKAVYGKVFAITQLPDYSDQFEIESEKRFFTESREYYLDPRVTNISKYFLANEVKENFEYEKALNQFDKQTKELPPIEENSGYAFACFSSFEAVSKFKKYSVKFDNKADLL